jgi:hypothetical protein
LYIVVVLGLLAVLILLGVRRKQAEPKPAALEYWVYLPDVNPPSTDALLTKLMQTGSIGTKEGLLFSDIRLHLACVLRARNAHLFMLDLLEEAVPLDKERLDDLAGAQALFKIRFVCDPPARDDRHLRLLPALAYAAASLSGSRMIYDLYQRRVFGIDELGELLQNRQDAARSEVHVRVRWNGLPSPGASTFGLSKKALPDLATNAMEADEENLVTYVVNEAAKTVWAEGNVPEMTEVEYFDGHFQVHFQPHKAGDSHVQIRIMRGGTQ